MRSKIIFPDIFFEKTYTIPVRITDINYGNHVGNDSVIAIIHEARVQFLGSFGYTELDIEGSGLIMADISVEFTSEIFYKDVIRVQMACGGLSMASFELFYKLSVVRNKEETGVARCKTGMVCYDYGRKKVVPLPAKFKAILEN